MHDCSRTFDESIADILNGVVKKITKDLSDSVQRHGGVDMRAEDVKYLSELKSGNMFGFCVAAYASGEKADWVYARLKIVSLGAHREPEVLYMFDVKMTACDGTVELPEDRGFILDLIVTHLVIENPEVLLHTRKQWRGHRVNKLI